jgi:threonine/homoserine/homoserine lactone efflux protein
MSEKTGKGLLSGIILSMANPYFLIWWFTVGFMLTIQSAEFGLAGLVAFIIAHEACDFTWLGFVGYSSGKIAEVWGKKAEKILKISSAAILIFFGFYFLLSGILELQKIWV